MKKSKKPSILRTKRLLKGKTLKEMAEITSLSVVTLSHAERHMRPVSKLAAKKIARAYGVKLSLILISSR